MTLAGRKVLLGITGGIAAYKLPLVLRGLQERGADVRVVMTPSAHRFVAPCPMEVLSRHPVHTDMWGSDPEFPVLHVGLAGWPDVVLVAPATAAMLARLAAGLADELLIAVLLATTAPVLLAPSMEAHMLAHPSTQANLELLRRRGCHVIEPATGPLASGSIGAGRMPEPAELIERVERQLGGGGSLAGVRVLVTAGPTLEDIDPVRFIGNRSSGKMGYALARQAAARGARVCLVSGPTALPVPAGVEFVPVRSTAQMQEAAAAAFADCEVAIMAAAPADFRPRQAAPGKLRRDCGELALALVATPDIAAGLGAAKRPGQILVVFALETEAGTASAQEKLRQKRADLVVLNRVGEPGAGFEVDTNVVTLIAADGSQTRLPLLSKEAVADRILDWVARRRAADASDARA